MFQKSMLARLATKAQVTCSLGVVSLSQPGLSVQEAIAAADEIMYQAKRSAKGAVTYGETTAANGLPENKRASDLASPQRIAD